MRRFDHTCQMCIEIEIDRVEKVSSSTTTTTARRVTSRTKMSSADPGRCSPAQRSPLPRSPRPRSPTSRSPEHEPRVVRKTPEPAPAEKPKSPKPGPSVLKRVPSGSPKGDKSVKFAVDDYDRPLTPAEMKSRKQSPKLAGEPRRVDWENKSGFPSNGCGDGDFTLFPSPLPSPPMSPLFMPMPPPKAAQLDDEARMRARRLRLEEEIAELTRRAVAREANHREQLRRRVEFESASREEARAREIDIEGSFSRRAASRRCPDDGSIDLSGSPRSPPRQLKENKTFSARFTGAFSSTHEHSAFFPTPLPSPAVSQVRSTVRFENIPRPLSRRQSHSPTRHVHAEFQRGECYRPRSLDSITPPVPIFQRGRSSSPTDNRAHGRSPSPADSICAVVGGTDTEDDVVSSDVDMTDSELEEDSASTTTSSAPCRDRRQCERCGLFGHELAECETPALTLPPRRTKKREWEPGSPTTEETIDGPPTKGLRHVKWMQFGNRSQHE